MNELIRCSRCGNLYNPDWKCACPTMCTPMKPVKRLHDGKPLIKSNGDRSQILRACDACGLTFDPMWGQECTGVRPPEKSALEKKVEALEERVEELERMHRTYE